MNWVVRREGLDPEERRVSCGVRASLVWDLKIQGKDNHLHTSSYPYPHPVSEVNSL